MDRSLENIIRHIDNWKSDTKVVVPKFIQELSRRNSVAHIKEVEGGKEADPRESSRELVAAVPKSLEERVENIEKAQKKMEAMVEETLTLLKEGRSRGSRRGFFSS